ncbi:DUF1285 domain-containing protein [Paracoccus ravus]|uniref:DUF1285 domain-containing protein n=1 Tax=Paracoccus ravus TaxID=2447760 RepID=UPI00106E4D30|nr:DUF1285 domain-containing protein [Paracoccus ravus]
MGGKTDNPVSAVAGLAEAAGAASKTGPAPVHLWDPPYCGEIDIEIRADGTWYHEGSPIGRPALVRLFASILKREGERHYLVTPVEKLGIKVQDAPFVAVDAELGATILFTTNLGDQIAAGLDHPVTVRGTSDTPRPYLHVRAGLMALIDRKTFYRLAEFAEPDELGRMVLRSGNAVFPLEP